MSNSKLTKIREKINTYFSNEEKVEFGQAKVVDSDLVIQWDDSMEPGTMVYDVVLDENGEVVEQNQLEAGEYQIEGDKIIVVDEESKLVEVKDVEVEEEVEEEVEQSETELEEVEEENKEEVVDNAEDVATITSNFDVQSLLSLINTDVDGYHTVDFSVEDGKIVFGSVYSQTYKSLLSEKEANDTKLSETEKENTELKETIELMKKETPNREVNLNAQPEPVKLSFRELKAQELADKRKNR